MLCLRFLVPIISALGNSLVVVATGDYGPDTCLQGWHLPSFPYTVFSLKTDLGWVWREAFTNDHVCVTGETRSQAAADNAQADRRREPNGGPYGPDTCKQGFVWREASPVDHVCVTVATRTQAAIDNSQAADRRASLNTSVTNWYPPGSSIPRFYIQGDHFNIASVTVGIYRSSDSYPVWNIDATSRSGLVGGSFGIQTDITNGAGNPSAQIKAYVQVYDSISTRSSTRIDIAVSPDSEMTISSGSITKSTFLMPSTLAATPPVTVTSVTSETSTATTTVATASSFTAGAKAGIGSGITIAGLLLLGAGWFVLSKLRSRQGQENVTHIDPLYDKTGPPIAIASPDFSAGAVEEVVEIERDPRAGWRGLAGFHALIKKNPRALH